MTQPGLSKTTDTARTRASGEDEPRAARRIEARGAEIRSADARGAEASSAKTRSAKTRSAKTRSAKTKIVEIVAVCTRCAKRQGLRRGDVRDRLKRAAKRALRDARAPGGAAKGSKLRVVETGCLGPCPKRGLAVATGSSLAAGRILLLDPEAGEAGMAAALSPTLRPRAALIDRGVAPRLPFAAHSCDDRASPPSDRVPTRGTADESPPPA